MPFFCAWSTSTSHTLSTQAWRSKLKSLSDTLPASNLLKSKMSFTCTEREARRKESGDNAGSGLSVVTACEINGLRTMPRSSVPDARTVLTRSRWYGVSVSSSESRVVSVMIPLNGVRISWDMPAAHADRCVRENTTDTCYDMSQDRRE
jgi:hypothetical protein